MNNNLIQPPLQESSCPDFPVIQYADDTILVLPAAPAQINQLKNLLLHYAEYTGLKVNYKSMLVPMHVPADTLQILLSSLGCQQGSFPFTYLGLPMGISKPKIEDFHPHYAED